MEFEAPLAVVILNACPQHALRETRAIILSEAGYYPASAGNADEANCLAKSVICSAAIICHSFKPDERRLIQHRIEKVVPAAKIIQLRSWENNDPLGLLSSVKEALGEARTLNRCGRG